MILTGTPPPDELEIIGREMRAAAMANQCRIAADCLNPELFRRIGEDYSVCVALELFPMHGKAIDPPRWHGSVCVLHETGSFNEFGMPEQSIMAVFQWPKEAEYIAREILGYLLGPVILTEKQVVQDINDRFSKHWFTQASPVLETYGNGNSPA